MRREPSNGPPARHRAGRAEPPEPQARPAHPAGEQYSPTAIHKQASPLRPKPPKRGGAGSRPTGGAVPRRRGRRMPRGSDSRRLKKRRTNGPPRGAKNPRPSRSRAPRTTASASSCRITASAAIRRMAARWSRGRPVCSARICPVTPSCSAAVAGADLRRRKPRMCRPYPANQMSFVCKRYCDRLRYFGSWRSGLRMGRHHHQKCGR